MKISKALLTAAAPSQRTLPLQSLVDRDGEPKTALQIILEEVLRAGIDEVGVVVHPGDATPYARAAGPHAGNLRFIDQPAPLGYGHAVWAGHEFIGDQPFLHLVADHLYVSRGQQSCAEQVVALASAEECAVSAVQATPERELPFYGTVGGRLEQGRTGIYLVEDVAEKPTPTEAEQRLIVPGLRSGYYLCFFGMHVFPPTIMEILATMIGTNAGGNAPHLTAAIAQLATRERCLALEIEGNRYDLEDNYGLLTTQLALALQGVDRDAVLTRLVELLATHRR